MVEGEDFLHPPGELSPVPSGLSHPAQSQSGSGRPPVPTRTPTPIAPRAHESSRGRRQGQSHAPRPLSQSQPPCSSSAAPIHHESFVLVLWWLPLRGRRLRFPAAARRRWRTARPRARRTRRWRRARPRRWPWFVVRRLLCWLPLQRRRLRSPAAARGGRGGGNGSEYVDASGSSASSSVGYHSRAAAFTPPQPRGGDGWGGRGGGWRGGRGGGNGRDRVDALGSSSAGYHSTAAAFPSLLLPRGGDGRGGRGGRNGSDRVDDLCSASTSSGGYHTTAAVRGGGNRFDDLCSSSTSSGGYHTTAAAFTPPQPGGVRGGWGGLGRGGGGWGGRGGGDVSDIVKALGSLFIGSSGGNHSRPAASTASQPRGGGRGGRGGEASERIGALGRLMTRVLRHLAAKLSLDMRTDGYVRVRDLLRLKLRTYADVPLRYHTVDEVREAVRQNSKQRLSLLEEDGELLIRANQGHSITTVNSESLLKPILSADEVSICVHGTFRNKLNSILRSGLNRMSRLHVHFSSGLPSDGEIISGVRKNVNILIHLDIRKALQDGMKLYISDNNVILTEGFDGIVPVKYFEKIESWPRRVAIPFER